MIIVRLLNYLRGYVTILVEGVFVEKFINICIKRKIFLWDIRKKGYDKSTLNMSRAGFKMLRPIVKKSKCRVKILKKNGLLFIFNRYKKRKILLSGIAIFILMFYGLTSFIWDIEVIGNKRIPKEEIIQVLDNMNIREGTFKYNIDSSRISDEIMLKSDDFAWISIVVKGTKFKIQVSERTKVPKVIPYDIPCDIVAKRPSIIKSVIAKSGIGLVKEGDTVAKGQIIVTGTVEAKTGMVKYVHAIADAKARTWYEASSKIETLPYKRVRTGNYKSNIVLRIFSRDILLFNPKVNFSSYEKQETVKKLVLLKDLVLPMRLNVTKFYENQVVREKVDIETAKKNALKDARKQVLEQIPKSATIEEEIVTLKETETKEQFISIVIECIEDIGEEKQIKE